MDQVVCTVPTQAVPRQKHASRTHTPLSSLASNIHALCFSSAHGPCPGPGPGPIVGRLAGILRTIRTRGFYCCTVSVRISPRCGMEARSVKGSCFD